MVGRPCLTAVLPQLACLAISSAQEALHSCLVAKIPRILLQLSGATGGGGGGRGNAHEIIGLLSDTSHLYLQEIMSNLVQVAALHGHVETAELYLSILDEKSIEFRGAIDQQAELVLSTMDAYIAIRTLNIPRVALARERYKNSGWKFESINGEYFFQYTESYLEAMDSKNCSSRVKFDPGQVQDQSIGNVMRILELDALSFCKDFQGLNKLLKNLIQFLHASTEASYDSLSRALEPYSHSIWAQEIVLKVLFRAQKNQGYLNKD